MRNPTIRDIRVLSVDFFSRGFGYTVFEGPDSLVDWGVASIRSDKEKQTLDRIQSFIALYRPHVLFTEDMNEKPSRRCERIKTLARKTCALAETEKISVHRVSRAEIRQAFAESNPKTKRDVSILLSKRFPELRSLLPPQRKPWMSEDERINVFDSAAFGCGYFLELQE